MTSKPTQSKPPYDISISPFDRLKAVTENHDMEAFTSLLEEFSRDPAMADIIARMIKAELDGLKRSTATTL